MGVWYVDAWVYECMDPLTLSSLGWSGSGVATDDDSDLRVKSGCCLFSSDILGTRQLIMPAPGTLG